MNKNSNIDECDWISQSILNEFLESQPASLYLPTNAQCCIWSWKIMLSWQLLLTQSQQFNRTNNNIISNSILLWRTSQQKRRCRKWRKPELIVGLKLAGVIARVRDVNGQRRSERYGPPAAEAGAFFSGDAFVKLYSKSFVIDDLWSCRLYAPRHVNLSAIISSRH